MRLFLNYFLKNASSTSLSPLGMGWKEMSDRDILPSHLWLTYIAIPSLTDIYCHPISN